LRLEEHYHCHWCLY